MILPIGHENQSVRRIPWVTIAIIAICLVVHIIVTEKMDKSIQDVAKYGGKYMQYYFTHPYLELDPEIEKRLFPTPRQKEQFQILLERQGQSEPSDSVIEMEQEELDALYLDFKTALDNIPHFKWGYTPAKKSFKTLISSMFVHAGWIHLILNMLFLYILAPFIEDIWGMPVFGAFYILMGILSASMHGAHYPQSLTPLVGASGAISGVMGAFLVNYWNSKIKFLFIFTFFLGGTFSAPAWLMLPLYLIKEFLSARSMDTMQAYGYQGGGVAHWVHVWGFVFGFLVAFAIKFFQIDKKFLAPKLDAETSYVNESANAVEKAMEMAASGEIEQAYTLMLETVRKDPYNSSVVEALWNLGVDTGRLETVAPYLQKLVEKEVRSGQLGPALAHFRPLKENVPDVSIATSAKITLLGQMVAQKEIKEAEAFGAEIANEVNLDMPPGLLIAYCNSMASIDLELNTTNAQPVIQMALSHPEIPDSTKEELKQRLFQQREPGQGESIPVSGQQQSSPGAAGAVAAGMAAAAAKAAPSPETISLDFTSSLDEAPPPPPPVELPATPPPVPPQEQPMPGTARDVELNMDDSPPLPGAATVTAEPPPAPPDQFVKPGEIVISLDHEPDKGKKGSDATVIAPPSALDSAVKRQLNANRSMPLGVKEGRLAINVDKVGHRALPLKKIKAIAVAKITPPNQGAFLLIDLFLDDPTADLTPPAGQDTVKIRSLRAMSTDFNPRSFIPNTRSLSEAFRMFTSGILKMSGATPLPDAASVQLQKMAAFPSIEAYEKAIIG